MIYDMDRNRWAFIILDHPNERSRPQFARDVIIEQLYDAEVVECGDRRSGRVVDANSRTGVGVEPRSVGLVRQQFLEHAEDDPAMSCEIVGMAGAALNSPVYRFRVVFIARPSLTSGIA